MTIPLRQSTASQEIPLGRFVDATDGNTEETGLTIANTDIKLWKMGATTFASKNSGGATHVANGLYYCVLDATDTNTLGALEVHVHVAGALAVKQSCIVLPANVYDALIAGTDNLQVDTVQVEGSDATDQIRDAVVDDSTRIDASALNTLSGHDPGETIMGATDLGTGSGLTSLASASALATVDSNVDAIKAKTDNLPSDPADESLLIAATDSILSRLGSPAGASVSADIAAVKTDTGTIKTTTDKLDDTLEDQGLGVYGFTEEALSAAPSGGSVPTAAEIADAVCDEVLSGHTTEGTVGERLGRIPNAAAGGNGGLPTVDANNLIAGIQGTKNQLDDLNDVSSATVNAQCDSALADYDSPTYAELLNLIRVLVRGDAAIGTDLSAVLAAINADLSSGEGDYDNETESMQAQAASILTRLASADITLSSGKVTVGTNEDKTEYSIGTGGIEAESFASGAVDAAALATDAGTEIAAAVFSRAFSSAYNSLTFDQIVKLITAVLLGKASGLDTTTATYRNLADNANAVSATVDSDGNRSAVTLNP